MSSKAATRIGWIVAGTIFGLAVHAETRCFTGNETAASLALFAEGAYKADIVVPEKMGGVEKLAAEELAYHFKKAFGKAPEVVGEDKFDAARHPFHIYLGATKAAVEAGLPVGKLADEEHVVKTVGSGLYLLGGDADTTYDEAQNPKSVAMRGTLYAAYDFLENEMGVKWLWPGDTGEVVPKRTALTVGAIDRRAQEPLELRYFYGGTAGKVKTGFTSDEAAEKFYCGQSRFLLRQRHGIRRNFHSGHSFAQWWKNYHEKHPEYFNMLPNGKRMPHRAPELCTMCVSEPGVWKQRVEEWRRWWAKASTGRHAPYPWVNCCDNDAAALCTCPRCRSWDGPDPRFGKSEYWNGSLANDFDKYLGKKLTMLGLSNGSRWTIWRDAKWSDEKAASVSDRYTRFYNEVAALAKQFNPDAKAIGYAYVNYIDPPLKTRVGPDTVIIFVPRSYFPYDDDESANFRRQWGGWHKMGATRMVLRPNYMLACGNHPNDTARRILGDFAFAATNGMFACQQDSLTGAWSAQAMHLYAVSRAMRDPLRGYEKARADMLAGFGAAARAVNRYFDMVEAHSAKWTYDSYREIGMKNITGISHDVGGTFRNPNAVLGDFFDERFFTDAYAALDEGARAAAGDAEVLTRIAFLRKGLRDTELGRNCRIAQKASDEDPKDAAKKAAYDAAYKALADYRASVEEDFVCDYAFHANWERLFVGWPHKVRGDKAKPAKQIQGE